VREPSHLQILLPRVEAVMAALLVLLGVAGMFFAVVFLPNILAKVLDPRNEKIIRVQCETLGFDGVSVKPWPNHYGVSYHRDGKKLYARCRVKKGLVVWLGQAPKAD
jgi:hypothetical protein